MPILSIVKTGVYLDWKNFGVVEGKLVRLTSTRPLSWYQLKPERVDASFDLAVRSLTSCAAKFIRHVIRPFLYTSGFSSVVFEQIKDLVQNEILSNPDLSEGVTAVFDAEFGVIPMATTSARSEVNVPQLITEEVIRVEVNRSSTSQVVRVQGFQNEEVSFEEGQLSVRCVGVKLHPQTGDYAVFASEGASIVYDEGKSGSPKTFENTYDMAPFEWVVGPLQDEVLLLFVVVQRLKQVRGTWRLLRSKTEGWLVGVSVPE